MHQLVPVEYHALLRVKQFQNVLGEARAARTELVGIVKQLKCLQDSRALFASCASCNTPQSLTNSLVPVGPRNQYCENRVFRAAVLEVGCQSDRTRHIYEVSSRDLTALALDSGPYQLLQCLGTTLASNLVAGCQMLVQPLRQLGKVLLSLVLIDAFVLARRHGRQ